MLQVFNLELFMTQVFNLRGGILRSATYASYKLASCTTTSCAIAKLAAYLACFPTRLALEGCEGADYTCG